MKDNSQPSPLALITIGDKQFRQRWFTESEVRAMLAEQRKKTIDTFTLNFSQVELLKEIVRLQEFAQRMVTEKFDAIAEARSKARAELIAKIQDRIRTMPRVRPGVYSLRDQIGAFHDGFEAGRMSALNSFARTVIPKP